MSIQRWYIQNPPGQPTEFVSYADHVAALRACEQRCDAKRHAEVKAWADLSRDNFDAGQAAGLSAARDAVAALRDENRQGTDPEWGVLNGALAAIDALINGQKEE